MKHGGRVGWVSQLALPCVYIRRALELILTIVQRSTHSIFTQGSKVQVKVCKAKEERGRLRCARSWAKLHGGDSLDSVVGEGRGQECQVVG